MIELALTVCALFARYPSAGTIWVDPAAHFEYPPKWTIVDPTQKCDNPNMFDPRIWCDASAPVARLAEDGKTIEVRCESRPTS